MNKLKVLTLNIRRDEGDDGNNNWEFRIDLVKEILNAYNPDIAVFQEVYYHQLMDLSRMMPEYNYVGVGREDGKEGGEFAPIFYKNKNLADSGNFWLSDTPHIPSKTWPGLKRICTWATFSGEFPFTILNTHLDNEYSETRSKSAGLIKEKIIGLDTENPVILAGDFNCTPQSETYRIMEDFLVDSLPVNRDIRDGKLMESYLFTYHDFKGYSFSPDMPGPIDYIWYKGRGVQAESKILDFNPSGDPVVYPSDHWPIFCDFTFTV